MFVKINNKILDLEEYSKDIRKTKDIVFDELEKICNIYGFEECKGYLINKDLNLAIKLEFKTINYLKPV